MSDGELVTGRAVEWLYLDRDNEEAKLAEWLDAALAHCAWTSHVVSVAPDNDGRLLESVLSHLDREPLAIVHLHQVAGAELSTFPSAVDRLMSAAVGFQNDAYRERTGARLIPLPILEVAPGDDPRPALTTATDLKERLAKPSLLLWDRPDDNTARTASTLGFRIYLGSADQTASTMEVLTAGHILDTSIDRVEETATLLEPCRSHLVLSRGRVFTCARQLQRGVSRSGISELRPPEWTPDADLCAGCIADVIAASEPSITANLRRGDGRELALRVSAALVDRGEHGPAAELAGTARELSDSDSQRADALIQLGLCRLAKGELEAAERALVDAEMHGAAGGLIAYHRARVQVAWRDDIEALDRYREVLEAGTDAVSSEDLHMEMALSHIRLEEWSDARVHLRLAGGPSPEISFNLAVCDLHDDHLDEALAHFDRALALGPTRDDLGRVRFFRGYCLKELERYPEAVDDLRRSIELEEPKLAHHNTLGYCLFKLDRHDEALTAFEQAVRIDPSSAVDWANIGVNLERIGELERAEAMYRKALGMDGSIEFAREGLERVRV